MLTLQLVSLLQTKGITKPYTWLKQQGIHHNMAYRLIHKPTMHVPIKVLTTICEAAWCTPSDLFAWQPSSPTADQPTHPLQALKPKPPTDIATKLKKLSPAQLHEIEEEIVKRINGEL